MILKKNTKFAKTVDVIWYCCQPPEIIESIFSYNYCKQISRELCEAQLNVLSWYEPTSREETCSCIDEGKLSADCLLVISNPELVVGPVAVKRMMKALEGEIIGAIPVFNETTNPSQIAQLTNVYLNLSTYLEVAEMMPCIEPSVLNSGAGIDCSCVLIQNELVGELLAIIKSGTEVQDALPSLISSIKTEKNWVIESSALIHSFGNYYGGKREDLVNFVPESAKRILDIGCANGGFGELIQAKRSDIHLTGVEMNQIMAKNASIHYDRIHTMKIEDVHFETTFDHINCGDIIEHLYDPWQMLKLLYSLLNRGGSFVVSLPNAGHWTVVKDLAAGEFQYLPVGLLCLTHIRWFTEKSIRQALLDVNFEIEIFHRDQLPPTPNGTSFIDALCQNGMGDRESLLTNQFTIRAWKK